MLSRLDGEGSHGTPALPSSVTSGGGINMRLAGVQERVAEEIELRTMREKREERENERSATGNHQVDEVLFLRSGMVLTEGRVGGAGDGRTME